MLRQHWALGLTLSLMTMIGCAPPPSSQKAETGTAAAPAGQPVQLLNVSYDPTRELWKDLNKAFAAQYEKDTGKPVTIDQSHGGSASQARAIVDGMKADVATLSIWTDTDILRKSGLLKDGWESTFPNRSLPYTSTLVFVVRKGNPKGIKDWPDLVKDGVVIVTPNPKTSGNGRLSLLAAWGSISLGKDKEAEAKEFLTKLYKNVPNLDTGARGATMTFAQKGIGDVHLTMESEAYLEVAEAKGNWEIVYAAISIVHEREVDVVDKVVDEKGTREAAEAYLKFLYTPAGQEIIAKHYYRPTDPNVKAQISEQGQAMKLFLITDLVANWDEAQSKFFADGAIFDGIYAK